MTDKIRGRIERSLQVKRNLLTKCLPQSEKAADLLVKAYLICEMIESAVFP